MNSNIINKEVFSKNVKVFDVDYWRQDEEEAIKFLLPGKLLLGGVGGGRTVPYLQQKGFIITAIDFSPEMVTLCRKKFPNLDIYVMDLQRTSFDTNLFDSIFLPFNTVAYTNNFKDALTEMHRILKPGGRLLFSVPNYFFVKSIFNLNFLRGKHCITKMCRDDDNNKLLTFLFSMLDKKDIEKIFPKVIVKARISLQKTTKLNWKDKILKILPFFDKSLYFFCTK
jgi:SAM-dependent methyltransferase